MVRKVVLGIFISILSIFLMSDNADAIELTLNLNDYEIVRNITRPTLDLYYNGNTTTCSGTANCAPFNSSANYDVRVSRFATNSEWTGNIDDVFILRVLIANQNPNSSDYTNGFMPIFQKNYTTTSGLLYLGNKITNYDGINIYSTYANTPDLDWYTNVQTTYKNFQVIEYYFQALNTQSFKIGFNSNSTSYNADLFTYYASDSSSAYYFKILNMVQYRFKGNEANREQEEKTQEAVDQSTSDGNSSQSSVEGSTQSLMSAGGSIISALVNAPATDCNISVNTTGSSRLFTTAIGQLNLCSDVPQGVLTMVQGIVALVFTPIVLYFTYNVLTTLYNQFKEYNS